MSQRKLFDSLFSQGKLTRRDFMQGATAFGITMSAASSLWSQKAAASPKQGGHLRMGLATASTSDSMDPGQHTDTFMRTFNASIRSFMVVVDHTNTVTPDLAESWEATPDAKVWTFKLRQGVEFHNGKTLDSEDVIDSLNYHRDENSKSGGKSLLDAIETMKADGKHSVVFTLAAGNADFPYILSDYHFSISPAGTRNFDDGMGSGPFIFESFEAGVRATAKRNPNYWKANSPHFDSIEMIGIADVNARTSALKSGEVDVINRCDVKTMKLLERIDGIQTIQGDGFKHYTLPMLSNNAPYSNNDVRLGLKLAIDREEILQKVLRGYGSVGNDTPISKNAKFFNPDIPQRVYDPEQAKFHMKKAGIGNHTFNLHVADAAFDGAVDFGVLYKEQAAKAGIDINVVREPNDGYWSNVWMKKEWSACYWSGRPTQDWMWTLAYQTGASWNDTNWSNERFDKLLVEARTELNEGLRHEMYNEMQAICNQDCGVVVPTFSSDLLAASDKCKFNNYAANFDMDGDRVAERWWFA